MASASLPTRQPAAGQVLEVTACFLVAKRFQNAVSSSKGRSLCPWPSQGLPAGISCHPSLGRGFCMVQGSLSALWPSPSLCSEAQSLSPAPRGEGVGGWSP